MKIFKNLARTFLLSLTAAILGVFVFACAAGSKPSTFYMLRSLDSPQESFSSADPKTVSVLLGPISLPGYLDRNQMVTVAGNNQVALDEFNRWAESLRDSFYRVLMEDLSLLLKTPEITAYDRTGSTNSDYQVSIDVTRFDCAPGGDAVLTAFWTVTGEGGNGPKIWKKSVFRVPVSSNGFSGMVEAQNQTLTSFGREIASVILSLEP